MAIIKACFNGLSPTESVTLNDTIYRNGAIIEVEEDCINPYVNVGVAFKISSKSDLEEALKVQDLEYKNLIKRVEILERAQRRGEQ